MTFCKIFGFERGVFVVRNLTMIGLVLFAGSCGVPTLESPVCIEARTSIREFYSFHFGNEMAVTADGLKARKRFLSQSMIEATAKASEGTDPFTTGTADIPRAFRVGSCVESSEGRAVFQVLLLWRDDESAAQKTVQVEIIEVNGRWLIDRVQN